MKRPAHLTLVDADKYSALVSRCTEQRKRAEKAEARIEVLERELAKLQPPSTLDRMIDEGHIDDSPSDY